MVTTAIKVLKTLKIHCTFSQLISTEMDNFVPNDSTELTNESQCVLIDVFN